MPQYQLTQLWNMADIIVCKPQLRLKSMTSDHRALVVQSTVEFELVDPASNASICDKKRLAPVEGEEKGAYLCHLTIAERRAQPSFCMCGRALNGKSEVLISYDFIIIVWSRRAISVLFWYWTGLQDTEKRLSSFLCSVH